MLKNTSMDKLCTRYTQLMWTVLCLQMGKSNQRKLKKNVTKSICSRVEKDST